MSLRLSSLDLVYQRLHVKAEGSSTESGVALALLQPLPAFCSRSRKRKRWILPVAVLGIAAMKQMARGYLYGARRSLTKRGSSASSAAAPSFKTTNALDLIKPSA